MITGDNPLTACHVGRVLKFLHPTKSLLLSNDQGIYFVQKHESFTKVQVF